MTGLPEVGRRTLPINMIRTDGGTQPRAVVDTVVDDYMAAMVDGAKFPPVTVFHDGTDYWLADGFHRVAGAKKAGLEEIDAELQQGTQQDAQWFSFGANKTNGLQRTNEDKQRAVKAAILHPDGTGKSDREIALHVGVDKQTVSNWREKLIATGEIRQSSIRTGRDGRTTNTSNIGKRKSEPSSVPTDLTAEATDTSPAQPEVPRRTTPRPPKPEPPRPNTEAEVAGLMRALYAVAEHRITASAFVTSVPDQNVAEVHAKCQAAWEFVGFAWDAISKRLGELKEVA